MKRLLHLFSTLAICALLAACGTDSSSGSSADGAEAAATGGVTVTGASGSRPAFSLRLTDAPVDNTVAVVMRFLSVHVRSIDDSWTSYTFDSPRSIDLLALQGSKTADLLVNMPLDNGDYDEIRLLVDESPMANYVDLGTAGVVDMKLKNGKNDIRIRGDFSVNDSRKASLVIDFDLRKSVKYNRGKGEYFFDAKVRLVELKGSGHIRGSVDPALLTSSDCSDSDVDTFNAAYVFDGHDAKLEDIDSGKDRGPVTTTTIKYDSATQTYLYEAAFLPNGDYTVALTCNADLEDPDKGGDKLRFFGTRNATVKVNNIVFL